MPLLPGIKEGSSGETSVFLWTGVSGEGHPPASSPAGCQCLRQLKKLRMWDNVPVPPVPAGVPAELGWPQDGNVAPQGCVSFSAGWSRCLLPLRLSVPRAFQPEALEILHLPLKLASFSLPGALPWSKPVKFSISSINSITSLQDGSQISNYPIGWIHWKSVPPTKVHFWMCSTSLWLLCQGCFPPWTTILIQEIVSDGSLGAQNECSQIHVYLSHLYFSNYT